MVRVGSFSSYERLSPFHQNDQDYSLLGEVVGCTTVNSIKLILFFN
jgi:hypothetical protein